MTNQYDPRDLDEVIDLVRETRDRMKALERRLKKVERKIAEEIDFELVDDDDEEDQV